MATTGANIHVTTVRRRLLETGRRAPGAVTVQRNGFRLSSVVSESEHALHNAVLRASNSWTTDCSNDSRHTHELIYHCFPKYVLLTKEWESKCHRQDQVNIKCARICSDHFESVTDYEDDMKNRLLGVKERKILKKSAVPSLNIPSSKAASDSNQDDRYQKRNIRKAALNHLQTLNPKKSRLEPSTGSSEYVNIAQGSEERIVVSEVHCLKCDERGKQIDLLNKKLMSDNSENIASLEKSCVLSFDEMSIDSRLNYHPGMDKVFGPHSKVQVDVLESFFSRIRGLGHFHDHPTPTDFIFRLICLLLSNKLPLPSNVIEDKDYELKPYLTADMLQSAFGIYEVNIIATENNATLNSLLSDEDDELRPMEGIEDANQEDLKSWAESEGLNNIAHKVKEKDSSLGQKTKNLGGENNTRVGILYYDGLTEPSEEWKKLYKCLKLSLKPCTETPLTKRNK
ncbi:hypothetical protein ANN_03443 [Periplaneta americana]|uniref:THAP-type domain-containing protein n=1 Tax=Periplaneta americana TaxID=6978 RepID=A0ABQ8TYZ6_PERAM|nr:hypothetical protein ANN_03443 [Periplaneta americana]